jgi:hypothetical protein
MVPIMANLEYILILIIEQSLLSNQLYSEIIKSTPGY